MARHRIPSTPRARIVAAVTGVLLMLGAGSAYAGSYGGGSGCPTDPTPDVTLGSTLGELLGTLPVANGATLDLPVICLIVK